MLGTCRDGRRGGEEFCLLYSLAWGLGVSLRTFWADNTVSVQSLSHVQFFVTSWIAACQAFLSITNSRSLPKFISIESVMPSNHLILFHPLLFLPSIFTSIRVFSNDLALPIRWPKYWSFSFNISPSNEHPALISFRVDWLGLPCETLRMQPTRHPAPVFCLENPMDRGAGWATYSPQGRKSQTQLSD